MTTYPEYNLQTGMMAQSPVKKLIILIVMVLIKCHHTQGHQITVTGPEKQTSLYKWEESQEPNFWSPPLDFA